MGNAEREWVKLGNAAIEAAGVGGGLVAGDESAEPLLAVIINDAKDLNVGRVEDEERDEEEEESWIFRAIAMGVLKRERRCTRTGVWVWKYQLGGGYEDGQTHKGKPRRCADG